MRSDPPQLAFATQLDPVLRERERERFTDRGWVVRYADKHVCAHTKARRAGAGMCIHEHTHMLIRACTVDEVGGAGQRAAETPTLTLNPNA